MNLSKWQRNPHGFFAVYLTVQRVPALSHREATEELNKEYGTAFERSTVTRMINATRKAMSDDANVQQEYDTFIRDFSKPRGILFSKAIKDGKEVWTSPYRAGKQFIVTKSRKKTFPNMAAGLNRIFDELGKIDPDRWTFEMVKPYLDKIAETSMDAAFQKCILIRNLLPRKFDTKAGDTPIPTDQYKRAVNERIKTYDLFTEEVEQVCRYLENEGHWFIAGLHRLHLILGCREGSVVHETDKERNPNGRSGLLGLHWSNLNWRNMTLDVFEGKVKRGILWRDCPLDNFAWDIKPFLEKIKTFKGEISLTLDNLNYEGRTGTTKIKIEPAEDVIINISYKELGDIYDYIESIYRKLFGKTRKFDDITPHTARHLHTNLLFERGVPSTVICGDATRGIGFVGVGWTDKTTMETYYLSLVARTVKKYIDHAKAAHGEFTPFEAKGEGASA